MAEMKPYADGDSSMTVGGLTVENGTERVNLSGSLDLAKDRQGLDHARALRAALDAIIAALEVEKDLPAKATAPKSAPTKRKTNPWA